MTPATSGLTLLKVQLQPGSGGTDAAMEAMRPALDALPASVQRQLLGDPVFDWGDERTRLEAIACELLEASALDAEDNPPLAPDFADSSDPEAEFVDWLAELRREDGTTVDLQVVAISDGGTVGLVYVLPHSIDVPAVLGDAGIEADCSVCGEEAVPAPRMG
jgi:hypothetical protein